MSLYVYKSRDFDETYENTIFEEIYNTIGPLFENRPDSTYLIGNFICQEKNFDALLIKNNSIIIIEFKNYGGKISFENNNLEGGIWKSNNVEIKCSQNYINPYRQVANYKTVLGDTLRHSYKIGGIDPYQSHGIVLFNKDITEINKYPDFKFYYWDVNDLSYNTWFHLVDKRSIGNKVKHISSRDIWFDDKTMNELISKIRDNSLMFQVAEYKRSDTTIIDYISTRSLQKESWLIVDSTKGISAESLMTELEAKTSEIITDYLQLTKQAIADILDSINSFTIADESEIKAFAESIFYNDRISFAHLLDKINNIADLELEERKISGERLGKLKSDFITAFLKKIRKSIEESYKKITRECAQSFDKKLLNNLMDIGDKIFAIKTGFFDVATGEKELEVEFNQKNNFLRLEIDLRSYLFIKYKESLADIAELLNSKAFAVVSFLPLFIQIPAESENHLTMQQYLLFAFIMQRNLNNEPCKETAEEIARQIMLTPEEIESALKYMLERKFIFNLDKSGSNRLYINGPKLIKIKNDVYSSASA
jgi:hypothetical protein